MFFTRLCAAGLVAASVSGCGGGVGGTGSAGNAGAAPAAPPPAVSVPETGLVPPAPAPGATLYADAAPLRVLRDGAVWTYHGIDQPGGEGSTVTSFDAYTNVVRQAAAGTGVLESASDAFRSGADSSTLRFEGGAYKSTGQFAFSNKAKPLTVDVIELRSPVKVNDQYVSLDKHIADSGADFDGDGINDAFDAAVYSRVIGEEVLDLPNRGQVKAVRVDMTLRARVSYSMNHTYSPVYEAVQSNWYAPGIGIVKARVVTPNTQPSLANSVTTEILENWDGLTEGLGHTDTAAAIAPARSALAGSGLQYLQDAVGFDTHAVAVVYAPGQASATGLALAQLDSRGKVVAARRYERTELFPSTQWFSQPRLLRVGDELRLFAFTGNNNVSMVALDATGQRVLRPAVNVLFDPQISGDYEGMGYRVVADGAGIWIGWLRTTQDADSARRVSLIVQHLDRDGQALGAERIALDAAYADIGNVSMALSGSRLALSWRQMSGLQARQLAMIDTVSGELVASRTLDIPFETCNRVDTLSLQPGLAMTCWNMWMPPLAVARLDGNGDPILPAGATLATDILRLPSVPFFGSTATFNGSGGQLFVSAGGGGKYWPEDSLESRFATVLQAGAGKGPLASSPVLLARIPTPLSVQRMVKLGNRLLLLGAGNDGYLNTTVVWLPQ
jgi:microcompartment protein CcmK/EutM